MPVCRLAHVSDAAALAVLAESTFRDTFAAFNSIANMNQHCRQHFSAEKMRQQIDDCMRTVMVCENNGVLMGYVQLHWHQSPTILPGQRAVEIQRIYVDKSWQGMGIGKLLMDTALHEAEQAGMDCVWLGVWEHNQRAIAFYQKNDFNPQGEHVFTLGDDAQRDLIMVRDLRPGLRSHQR